MGGLHYRVKGLAAWPSLAAALLLVAAGGCARQDEPAATAIAAPGEPDLAARFAAGERYVLVTRRDLFPRPSQGLDDWFAITGYYVPQSGLWTSSAAGFPSPGTPWHSCPAETRCGGIHEPGLVLERWYRPERHELVAVGVKLTFDESGRVFHGGRQIGTIFTPAFAPNP